MLHNIKRVFRYEGHRTPSATEIAPKHITTSHTSHSDNTWTAKVFATGKYFYTTCKAKLSSSRSSLRAHCTESRHSVALSSHTSVMEISHLPNECGNTFMVSGCDTTDITEPTAAPSPASVETLAHDTTDVSKPLVSVSKQESVLDDSCLHTDTQSGPGRRSLRIRLVAKFQKVMAVIVIRPKASVDDAKKSIQVCSVGYDNGEDEDDDDDSNEHVDEEGNHADDELEVDTDTIDGGEDHQGPSHSRSDWKVIHAVSDARIKHLVEQRLCSDGNFQVTSRTFGTYNLVAFIENVAATQPEPGYVIRIPAHGTLSHWTEEDAYMLEREVQLVEHIRRNTKVPVPRVLDYCSDCDNELEAPFILMTKLPGKSAYDIWFDLPYSPSDAFRNADVPSIATEKKRVNFLRSLARTMTELQTLSFDKIGMPLVSEDGHTVTVAPSYYWGDDEEDVDNASERPTFPSTQMYIQMALAKGFKVDPRAEKNPRWYRQLGARKILNTVFAQPVFRKSLSTPETFTIHHNDLDLQNILVDREGNVTGIIDWDNSFAAPRCIGTSAVPIFLRSDWFPRYTHGLCITPHMGWNEHYYRQIYAAAMVEAGNPDAKYTLKSAIYQACTSALYEGGDYKDLIEKLVRYIPECRIDAEDLMYGLGMQWPAATEMLERELKIILEPQLPDAGFLESLHKMLILKEWWSEFRELLDFYQEEEYARPRSIVR